MKSRKTFAAIILTLLLSMTGCAAFKGSYGVIALDDQARRNFESFKLDPSMNYYYSGPDVCPNALIGLEKRYELDNDLWKPVEPDRKLFKSLILGMQNKAKEYALYPYGFAIKDPRGQPLGVWYSILSVKTMIVKMGKGNKVEIYTPEQDIYPKFANPIR